MNTEKIFELLNSTKKGDYPLAMEIGLGRSSIQSWRRGLSAPNVDALIKIADYFNVSLDYLVGRDTPTTNTTDIKTLNKTPTTQLPDIWNELDEEQQHEAIGFMKALAMTDIPQNRQQIK